MSADRYSLEEEMALAAPIALDEDLYVCDRGSCMRAAEWIVPGAYLCSRCLERFRREGGRRYSVPVTELAVGIDGRQRRRRDYAQLLKQARARDGGLPRSDSTDGILDDLVALAVDDLIRSVGAQP